VRILHFSVAEAAMDMLSIENNTTVVAEKAKLLLGLKHHAVKTYGEWKNSSIILNLGGGLRRPISFTTLPLYPRRNSFRHLLFRRLGGPTASLVVIGKRKISLTYWE
jgi:hypothetical protein